MKLPTNRVAGWSGQLLPVQRCEDRKEEAADITNGNTVSSLFISKKEKPSKPLMYIKETRL